MKSSFFIVADRGNLKAFRAEKVPADRPPRLQLVQAFTLTDAHMKIAEKHTDMAGAFPSGTGGFQNSHAERHYNVESDRRAAKQLAAHIHSILTQEQPGWWSFAAPSDIHSTVVDQLDPQWRAKIAEHVDSDLVNTPETQLLRHFSEVRAS